MAAAAGVVGPRILMAVGAAAEACQWAIRAIVAGRQQPEGMEAFLGEVLWEASDAAVGAIQPVKIMVLAEAAAGVVGPRQVLAVMLIGAAAAAAAAIRRPIRPGSAATRF